MKNIELLDKLRAKPVFRVQDVERLGRCKETTAKQTLRRLRKRDLIKHVRRNIYTAKTDIYIIASNIVWPCYISFWSASSFLGYTEQILNTVYVATRAKALPAKFEGYTIEFVPMKHFFGYRKITTKDGDIFIAEDEKLAIDCLLRPDKSGNFDEIKNVYKKAELSKEKFIEYLKRLNSQSVIKRAGYLLEKTRGLDISKEFSLDNNYVQLNPYEKGSKTVAKWRIRI